MGKQTGDKRAGSGIVRTRKGDIEPFTFLGISFNTVDAATLKKHAFF